MSKVAVIGIVENSVFLPVDKFHVGGETIEVKSVTFELGGKGFNKYSKIPRNAPKRTAF